MSNEQNKVSNHYILDLNHCTNLKNLQATLNKLIDTARCIIIIRGQQISREEKGHLMCEVPYSSQNSSLSA